MLKKMLWAWAGLTLTGSALMAQQVKTDYDHNADFGRYRTFSWTRVQTQNPLWVDRIKSAVDSSLSAKGWMEVPSGGDVALVAMEINQNHRTLNTYYDNFGGGWIWGGGLGEATTTVSNYEVGTLVVDMFDAQNKKLIWRGSASDTISDKPDKNIKTLEKGTQKMFDHFPPKGK